jgi:GGDEF domain-containing protein
MQNLIYLITDLETRETAIIDPAWDISSVNNYIEHNKLILKKILLTHSHHDHVNSVDQILSNHDIEIFLNHFNFCNKCEKNNNNINNISCLFKNAQFEIIKINDNTVNFDGTDIKISSSGGVAFSSETNTSADLTNKADERLYEAKKSGRNRFKLIDSELVGD